MLNWLISGGQRKIEDQTEEDLLWIRRDFLYA